MVKTRRERKKKKEEMASVPIPPIMAMPGATDSASKPIPLVCSVCPSTPSFSDSSHLLTHIASKGHLHHETQTKLRAHQDLAASYALRQYEQWYRENNIETLLVDRLKAKQDKEAARVKRVRENHGPSEGRQQIRKKPKRILSSNTFIKTEQEGYAPELASMFAPFRHTDQIPDLFDDLLSFGDIASSEAMALKGQVYPGMGKMDLANEEMKRTRNQRKPKSVVDRMKRTSEGITSMQVVMTPDFEVERVKDVYDDESPAEDDDQSPPRKTIRARRKKNRPLADLSTNAPRMTNGILSRDSSTSSGLTSKPVMRPTPYMAGMGETSVGPFRPTIDVFRDERPKQAFDGVIRAPELKREPRYSDQFAMHTLNPISQSTLSSPSPSTRDVPQRTVHGKDPSRSRFQAYPYYDGSPLAFGAFAHTGGEYSMNDPTMYQSGPHSPYFGSVYHGTVQEQYRMHLPIPTALKQDQSSSGSGANAMCSAEPNLFLNFPNTSPNPLLAQDRNLLSPYPIGSAPQPTSPVEFTSISRNHEHTYATSHNHDFGHETPPYIKLEAQTSVDSEHSSDDKDHVIGLDRSWDTQGPGDDLLPQDDESQDAST